LMKHFIGNDWDQVLEPVFESDEYHNLHEFLRSEYQNKQI